MKLSELSLQANPGSAAVHGPLNLGQARAEVRFETKCNLKRDRILACSTVDADLMASSASGVLQLTF
eukprot:3652410-Rhodomonas_salina.3